MYKLTEEDLRDIIEGCTILGTGGGGDPNRGWSIIIKELERGKEFYLMHLDEVSEDGIVPMPYNVGSLSGKIVNSVYEEGEAVRSFEILENFLGKKFTAVISTELGGANTAIALATAARLGKPIVDGDPAGRSVPELQHSTYHILGLKMAPFSVVTPFGDEIIIQQVKDDFQAEKIVRSIVASIKANVGVTSHPLSGNDLKHSVVENALSFALRLGRAVRIARQNKEDPIKSLIKEGKGYLLFKGVVTKSTSEDKDGFTIGEFEMDGLDEFNVDTYRVIFKNENMVSLKNEKIDVTVPDLISVLTIDGYPVTNPNVKKGKEYFIIGFPAHNLWRKPEGLEIFGPKYLGLSIEYVPIEKKYGGM